MKQSAIIDIFKGSRGSHETIKMPERINQMLERLIAVYDKLKEKLSPELTQELREYADEATFYACEQNDFYFAEGFKLGLLVGMECFEKD